MAFVTKKISNHPVLTDVERYVTIYGFSADARIGWITINYSITYKRGPNDVTSMFAGPPSWVVTNDYDTFVRNSDGSKVPDPDNEGEFLKMPAYDYFKQLVFDSPNPVRISELMEMYILIDDAETQRFDY